MVLKYGDFFLLELFRYGHRFLTIFTREISSHMILNIGVKVPIMYTSFFKSLDNINNADQFNLLLTW